MFGLAVGYFVEAKFLAEKFYSLVYVVVWGSLLWSWCLCGLFLTPSVVLFTCHFFTYTYTTLALFWYFLGLTRCFVSGFPSAAVPVCFSILTYNRMVFFLSYWPGWCLFTLNAVLIIIYLTVCQLCGRVWPFRTNGITAWCTFVCFSTFVWWWTLHWGAWAVMCWGVGMGWVFMAEGL